LSIAVQVQGTAGNHDPAVTHAGHDVFTWHVVREGDGCIARVRVGLGANLQLTGYGDPFGGQFEISLIRKSELAVEVNTVQSRWTDVENDIHALTNGHDVASPWNISTRPGGCIRPVSAADRLLCEGIAGETA